jgi:hypothetical protein
MAHKYFSVRTGKNKNTKGFPLKQTIELFLLVYDQFRSDGYFDEAFGFTCIDRGEVDGKLRNIELSILLEIRKKDLWPIHRRSEFYSEDDFFDVVEFLFQQVSKPIDGNYHSFADCGMHWETFNKIDGQVQFREKINEVLAYYEKPFELSSLGEVLNKPEVGFDAIFEADIPSKDVNIVQRINSAVLRYRRHGASLDDRRQSVRDLVDVLEFLRPKVKEFLTNSDEKDLFNIANNFGIRHLNDKQKIAYDQSLWLSWMFYFYLSTIHVVLRKIGHSE